MNNQYSIGLRNGVRRNGAPLILALTALLCFLFSAQASAANDLLLMPAIKSRLAQSSVLMDVVNTGKRLVAVGERGRRSGYKISGLQDFGTQCLWVAEVRVGCASSGADQSL